MAKNSKKPEENLQENPVDNVEKVAATTMDALVADETLPEVQQPAIDAFNEKAAAEKQEAAALEAQGVKLKADGTPAKKRGRKSNAEKGLVDPRAPKAKSAEEIEAEQKAQDSLEAAAVVSGILEQLQVVLISDEFKYEEIERVNNIQAWKDTFDHYGGVSLSPPARLAMSHASIIMTRAMRPKSKTQEKMALAKVWIVNKFSRVNVKFWQKKKDNENARTDNRADDVGQDDVRGEESASAKK